MESQEMDVFARAWIYLGKTVYANHGIDADVRVVRVAPPEKAAEERQGE